MNYRKKNLQKFISKIFWKILRNFFSCGGAGNSSRGELCSSSHEVQKRGQNKPKLSKQAWLHMEIGPQIPNLRSDLASEAVWRPKSNFFVRC